MDASRQAMRGTTAGWARSWPSLVALAACCIALVMLAFDSGGYFPSAFLPVGAGLFAVLALVLAVHLPHWRFSDAALVALGALAGLAAWTGLSATWAPDPSEAVIAFERALLYTAFFALALIAAGSGRPARLVLWSALGVATVIVGAGLLSRLFPGLFDEGALAFQRIDYRLSYPLTYWNAYGALASLGAILAVGLAADPRAPVVARAVTGGLAVLLAVAMYFSLSRGAWLATAVGLVALFLLGAHRGSLLLTLAVVGGAFLLAVLRLRGYDALVDNPRAGDGQRSEGRKFAVQLALLALAAGGLQAVIAGARRSVPVMDAARRLSRVRVYALGAALLIALCVYVAAAGRIEGRAANGLDDTADWISEQWDEFMTPASYSRSGTGRLTTAKGSRSDMWRVAFDGFEAHPLRGDGAGGFELRWTRERELAEDARDGHSLGFETLGELGLVGGLLLLAFVGAVVRAAVRSRLRTGSLRRSEAAAAGAAVAVWVAHTMVDWDWQLPAVTGVALLAAAPLFPEGRRVGRRRRTFSS